MAGTLSLDWHIEISAESGGTVNIDENMLLEAMPDFMPLLPHELDLGE